MSSNKTKISAAKKARNASYGLKGSAAKNAKLKLARHIKAHPNDEQALGAQARGVGRTRKTPTNRLGWVSDTIKTTMSPTPPTRRFARALAQVLAFSAKIARTSRTKEEQVAWRKILQAQSKDVKKAVK